MIPHILTGQNLTCLLDGRSIAIPRSHTNFDAALLAVQNGDPDALRCELDVKTSISNWTSGAISIDDRFLSFNGRPLDTSLTRKIIEFMKAGDTRLAQPLMNFLEKVMTNPSRRAAQGLYDWVAVSGMPIHEDGDILAWKIVKEDFFDYHTGTLNHFPGYVVEQPRNECDEDPDQTCSHGIHFCSYDYLEYYHQGDEGRRIMLVKVNPADVVAIPRDYNTAKGRCCRLEVIEQVADPDEHFEDRFVYFESEDPKFEVDPDNENEPLPDFLPLKLGVTYVTREGGIVTVTSEYDSSGTVVLDTGQNLFADTGRANFLDEEDRRYDIVDVLDIKVGDHFRCRNGKVRQVTGLRSYGVAQINDNNDYAVFATSGRQLRVGETEHDLIRKITPIDWSAPLEYVDGREAEFNRFDTTNQMAIAVVNGNYYDRVTGEHIYGYWPTVRNVT